MSDCVECLDGEKMHIRLKKIIGQLTAIDRMVEERASCEEILIQIMAAKSALQKARNDYKGVFVADYEM